MITLMYHRISRPDTNPWGVCVSPEHFEAQICWLTSRYPVITPSILAQQIKEQRVDQESVLITFDDAYQDNFITARPILERYQCPATFFVPSFFTGRNEPFWWDELEWIFLLAPIVPGQLELSIAGATHRFRLEETALSDPETELHRHWRWYEDAPTLRASAFLAIWSLLRPLAQQEIEHIMSAIRDWSQISSALVNDRLPMNDSALREMAANPLFSIGLHTHTHPDLAGKSVADQRKEITRCRDILQKDYSTDSRWLAYPYGRYDAATLQVAREMDLELCFTTDQTPVTTQTSRFELGRLQAPDAFVNEFQQLLSFV